MGKRKILTVRELRKALKKLDQDLPALVQDEDCDTDLCAIVAAEKDGIEAGEPIVRLEYRELDSSEFLIYSIGLEDDEDDEESDQGYIDDDPRTWQEL